MVQIISNQRLNSVYEDTRIKTPLSRNERALQFAKLALVVIGLGAAVYVAYRCGSNHEMPEIEKLKKDIELLSRQRQDLEEQLRLEKELAQNTRNCEAEIKFLENSCETKIKWLKGDHETEIRFCETSLSSCKEDKVFWEEYYSRNLEQCEQRGDRYKNMLLDDLQRFNQMVAVNSSGTGASVFLELWAKFLQMYQ